MNACHCTAYINLAFLAGFFLLLLLLHEACNTAESFNKTSTVVNYHIKLYQGLDNTTPSSARTTLTAETLLLTLPIDHLGHPPLPLQPDFHMVHP
jgi:hypothetical protein